MIQEDFGDGGDVSNSYGGVVDGPAYFICSMLLLCISTLIFLVLV